MEPNNLKEARNALLRLASRLAIQAHEKRCAEFHTLASSLSEFAAAVDEDEIEDVTSVLYYFAEGRLKR